MTLGLHLKMLMNQMEQTTEEKKDRVQRVLEAHTFLRDSEVRLMLCHEYQNLHSDPTIRGPEDIQLRMEAFVDVLLRMSEHAIRNHIALVQEYITVPWEEAMEAISLLEDED